MTLTKTESLFVNALKKKAPGAHKNTRDKEVVIRGGGLPDGISRGIAKFADYKTGTIAKGNAKGAQYISLTGIVCEPTQYKGLRATKTIYFRDTANKTVADQVDDFNNELKKLGCDLSGTNEEDWFRLLAEVKANGTYFYFHTWKGDPTPQFPNPQVNTEFDGGVADLADYVDPNAGDGVVDNTTAPASSGAQELSLAELGAAADAGDEDAEVKLTELASEAGIDPAEIETWTEVATMLESADGGSSNGEASVDVHALGAAADEGDEDAASQLTEMAKAQDIDPDAVETWTEVATMLNGEAGGEESSGEIVPEKGQMFNYRAPRAQQAETCEITAVFAGTQKCNLKRVSDDKLFKGIPWEKLER